MSSSSATSSSPPSSSGSPDSASRGRRLDTLRPAPVQTVVAKRRRRRRQQHVATGPPSEATADNVVIVQVPPAPGSPTGQPEAQPPRASRGRPSANPKASLPPPPPAASSDLREQHRLLHRLADPAERNPKPRQRRRMDEYPFAAGLDGAGYSASASPLSGSSNCMWTAASLSEPLSSPAGATKAATASYQHYHSSHNSPYFFGGSSRAGTPGVVMASPATVAALAASSSMYEGSPGVAVAAAINPSSSASSPSFMKPSSTVYTFRRESSSSQVSSPGKPNTPPVTVTTTRVTEETTFTFDNSGDSSPWVSSGLADTLHAESEADAAVPLDPLASPPAAQAHFAGALPHKGVPPLLAQPPLAHHSRAPVQASPVHMVYTGAAPASGLGQHQQHAHAPLPRPGSASISSGDDASGLPSSRRKLQCTVCGRHVIGQRGLNRHMRIHTGDKPFPCTQCGRSFRQKGTLTSHMRIHSGEQPYRCKHCSRPFRHHGSMKRHIRSCAAGASGSNAGSSQGSGGSSGEDSLSGSPLHRSVKLEVASSLPPLVGPAASSSSAMPRQAQQQQQQEEEGQQQQQQRPGAALGAFRGP